MESLIAAVREQDEAARFLAWPGDFDLDRGDHVEEAHLASGAALEGFAGDGARTRTSSAVKAARNVKILYADSEGGAALVAIVLPELLRLLLVAPWWRGCQAFTEEESRELAAEYLEDMPDLEARRHCAAAALVLRWVASSGKSASTSSGRGAVVLDMHVTLDSRRPP
ncbi:hypothetical protein ACFYWN_37295 [Streptomyces sp. NPDC002917]|uniref:hypothetical protein n=1 Tax=Streptomyces sp. NPDC002917 TaxID=3364671 RepID=UPI0036C3E886